MAHLNEVDTCHAASRALRAHFRYTKLECAILAVPGEPVLTVYVFDAAKVDEVKAYSAELEKRFTDSDMTLKIAVKLVTGPWPPGETVEQLRQKREDFIKRYGTKAKNQS